MKNHTHLVISALSIAMFALLAPTSFAQKGAAMSKAQAIAQQLNLTPQQKEKILPILAAEVPKVHAIKNDNSFSTMQKMQQLRAIHQQTDPEMKAILSPETEADSCADNPRSYTRHHGPLMGGHQSVSVLSKSSVSSLCRGMCSS